MDPIKDFYDVLGVPRDTEQKAIKRAYRARALESHPDRNPDNPQAEERFKEIQAAFGVLGDPQKRRLYDRYGLDGLRRGFSPPENGTNSDVWNDYARRWREAYEQRAQRDQGIVLRGVDPDSDLLQRINALKSKLQNTVREKSYFDLKDIAIDLMGIYDAYKTGSRCRDGFRESLFRSSDRGGRLEGAVLSIPEYTYNTVFPSYDERSDRFFGGGFTVIEELLENRLQDREMRELEKVCEILNKDPKSMKGSLAVNTIDIYVMTCLQEETKGHHGMEFKPWNWKRETRKIADDRVDHYSILRRNLGEVLGIGLSDSESALVQRYLQMTLGVGRRSGFRMFQETESEAFYEDGFMTTAAGVLLNRALGEERAALIRYGGRGTTPQNYLSEALTNAKGDILRKIRGVFGGAYSYNQQYAKKKDLRSFVDVVKRMAQNAGTKEAMEVASKATAAKIQMGVWF